MAQSEEAANFKSEFRKEIIAQGSKWLVGAVIALIGFALMGWWFYLKPQLNSVIGGIPKGAVVAFDARESCPTG